MTKSLVDQAIADPSRTFPNPIDVLAAKDLSREEKIKILQSWEHDAKRLLESAYVKRMRCLPSCHPANETKSVFDG